MTLTLSVIDFQAAQGPLVKVFRLERKAAKPQYTVIKVHIQRGFFPLLP